MVEKLRKYSVKEIFLSVQGEGYWSGVLAIFVRFSGCNVWNGREDDRLRDSDKGVCALWCDTDFVGVDGQNGGKYTSQELVAKCVEISPVKDNKHVIFTGGEPSLQLTDEIVAAFDEDNWVTHVETNGVNKLPDNVDWVTLSPKPPLVPLKQRYDEVKVIYDGSDDTPYPLNYNEYAVLKYVQPLDVGGKYSYEECVDFISWYPSWRLSLQTHKILGLP